MKMKLTEAGRKRLYLTRQMMAGENEVHIEPQYVEAARALGYVEELSVEAPAVAAKPRGRPRKAEPAKLSGRRPRAAAAAKADEPAVEEPKLEDIKRDKLLEIAKEKGVELPTGYVPKDKLVDLLEETDEADPD